MSNKNSWTVLIFSLCYWERNLLSEIVTGFGNKISALFDKIYVIVKQSEEIN